ncbi:hypothetical protein BJ684DRAFT_17533 [Piptocephalis cylindrospora]|uniref:Coronin n=1 Tax=Piptocephalis cylindrospora TaxID=1907219 RepID=A0A4P9Y265_9FUNG|nr:hypothetical protein BJ684DRAFT_17533 [Piptocephalis cylindrospora]|eukprot:RKP11930.1 hypothetical protein BJ684DRAFT_17533 [Piptocephalis cylindrospora]
MSRFVRASKFRHVYGTPAKRDGCYDNLRISTSAWDTNVIKVNPKYLAVNWNAGGGGAFAVLPLDQVGRQTQEVPLFSAHSAPVLDTEFSPFNDQVIASAGEDAKVMVWNIPEEPMEESETNPAVTLTGHRRKVGHVLFHPVASNVLASSSADHTVKLWDVEHGTEKQELGDFGEVVQSLTWNYNGSLLATTCRDKKIRIHDVRSNTVVQVGDGHQGIKGSRVVWLGNCDRFCTTGFSRSSDRQLFLWDTKDLSNPLKQMAIDSSSGNLMPFYDEDTKMLYLAGKGDGNIRYYELENDDLFSLSEYKSTEPQRGMAFLPKRALNVNECEVARAYKVTNNMVEPISFTVPRKADFFQSDIFPPTVGDIPSLTAEEFFSGKDANPILVDLEKGFSSTAKPALHHVDTGATSGVSGKSTTSSPSRTPARTPSPTRMEASAKSAPVTSNDGPSSASQEVHQADLSKEVEAMKRENDDLKKKLSEVDLRKAVSTTPQKPDESSTHDMIEQLQEDSKKMVSQLAEVLQRVGELEKKLSLKGEDIPSLEVTPADATNDAKEE